MGNHSRYNASGMATWARCTAQLNFIEKAKRLYNIIYRPSHPAATLGTAAHELGEMCLKNGKTPDFYEGKKIKVVDEYDPKQEPKVLYYKVDTKMIQDVSHYVKHCNSIIKDSYDPKFMVEARFFLNHLFEFKIDIGGSSDFSLIDFRDLVIVDYKNGKSPVNPVGNDQLQFYALGVYEKYRDLCKNVKRVTMVIVQPNAGKKAVKSHTVPLDELLRWRDERLIAKVRETRFNPTFAPSNNGCFWCPVKSVCTEYIRTVKPRGKVALADENWDD